MTRHIKANEMVVVEAHLVEAARAVDAGGALKTTKNGGVSHAGQEAAGAGERRSCDRLPENTLLGRVVINTDVRFVDKKRLYICVFIFTNLEPKKN